MLRRNTSAPASNSFAIISGLSEAGPRVARIFVRRARLIVIAPLRRLVSVSWIVQLCCSPVSTSKNPLRSKPSRQAILGPADREFPLAGAHEGAPAPIAAPVVIEGVDVIEASGKLAFEQGLAGAGAQVPPSLRDPALRIPIAERDADAAARHVAQPEVRMGGAGRQQECRRQDGRQEGQDLAQDSARDFARRAERHGGEGRRS